MRELNRIRAMMEKETKVGSIGVELQQPYGLYVCEFILGIII